MMQSTMYCS